MAANIDQLIKNLLSFYSFKEKIIISVGAGGGQLIAYGSESRRVVAIDNDKLALEKLQRNLKLHNLKEKFEIVHSDFLEVKVSGDVVLFEFCLHEMELPEKSIKHALSITSDIIIMDHCQDSEWAYIADEKEKVTNSWNIVNQFKIKKQKEYFTHQYFKNYEELYEKVKVQGQNSINRISKYKGLNNIEIPMSYKFVMIA